MRIMLASVEVNPFAKTGGLADVAGSLSRAIRAAGHDIRVVLPAFRSIEAWKKIFIKRENSFKVRMGGEEREGSIWEGNYDGLPVYLIEHDDYYNRDGLYGGPGGGDYPDNARRFAFFCHAVMESLPLLSFRPEIIHCNDWHTALIPVMLKTSYQKHPFYHPIRTVYTIHNLGYQGQFDVSERDRLGLDPELLNPDLLETHGKLNFMQGGIIFADILTTVSPTYAQEIQTPELGFGLEGTIRSRSGRLYGILNGIDVEEWNTRHDPWITHHYDSSDFGAMKLANKNRLRQELNLEAQNGPLLAVVSRLAEQKGIGLVLEAMPHLMQLEVQVVVLGTGDRNTESELTRIARQYPGRISVNLTFSNPLAHRIYAGADILLIPSRYEPCGLTQMIGLRYGAVPLVRSTGGLVDTVIDVDDPAGRGNGFVFSAYQTAEFIETCRRAVAFYHQTEEWNRVVRRGMDADYSWKRSALEYIALYYKVSVE